MTRGANVTVVDARDRPGGRVWTLRNGFAEGQHAEAGGETIDEAHDAIRALCAELGLTLNRALRAYCHPRIRVRLQNVIFRSRFTYFTSGSCFG